MCSVEQSLGHQKTNGPYLRQGVHLGQFTESRKTVCVTIEGEKPGEKWKHCLCICPVSGDHRGEEKAGERPDGGGEYIVFRRGGEGGRSL